MVVIMSKKKTINVEAISYCDKCYNELDSNNDCSECEPAEIDNRKSIESVYPEYKKMFLPKDEGITWDRVR